MLEDKQQKDLIGRLERVSLPEFGLENLEAKIDTGAYNGSIHVSEVYEEEVDGKKVLKFKLLDEEHEVYNDKVFSVEEYEIKKVKNSLGDEDRYFIPTKMVLKNKEFNVKLGLADRTDMRRPILIGRKIIKNHFIVDASKKFTD